MGQFGELISQLRLQAEKTLREVASVIEISVSQLSDIEHGRRKPFSPPLIERFVQFVGGDRELLLKLAAKEHDAIEIPTGKSDGLNILAYALQRADPSALEDEHIKESIQRLVEDLERKTK